MIYTCGVGRFDYQEVTVEQIYSYFKNKDEISVDTETTGKDCRSDKIISLQVGDKDTQFFIDCRTVNIRKFKTLLESNKILGQNFKFDYKMLKAVGIIIESIYDTMVAECIMYCGYDGWGYALDRLVQRYTGIILSKEERKSFLTQGDRIFSSKQIEYGATDVRHLGEIRDNQRIRIREQELEYCIDLEMKVIPTLGDIEYNGMGFDPEKWLVISKETKELVKNIKKRLDEIVLNDPKTKSIYKPKYLQGDLFGGEVRELNINHDSHIQILKLCHALGFKIPNTNEREIGKLAKTEKGKILWEKHPFFGQLLLLREYSKIVSTYGENFLKYINPKTQRIHTSFWQIQATGRVASGNKDDNAPNVQNIPADNKFRNCFVARPGFSWVSIDYSGQELRLMADASGEQGFIDVLSRGEDLHCYAGSMMFKKPVTKEDKDLRNKAKTINFGKPYGMGPNKLADMLGITLEESAALFKEYAEAFPTLEKWLAAQSAFAKKYKYSTTFAPCKRRRFYPDMDEANRLRAIVKRGDKDTWRRIMIIEGSTEREGGNSPIQGSGADMTKEALVEIRELIKDYNEEAKEEVAFLICTVHDAIDVEVRDDLAEKFAKEMDQIMVDCGNKYLKEVRMEVDVTITKEWKK